MKLAKTSVALLIIQLAIVSYHRGKVLLSAMDLPPRVDPDRRHRSRAADAGPLSEPAAEVDGCQSTLPSAKAATFPRDVNGAAIQGPYRLRASATFRADLKVENNRLLAIALQDDRIGTGGQVVSVWPGAGCGSMRLDTPVDFYIAEHAMTPLPLKPGEELWIEVTVPPNGPPRPTQLALKDNGAWKPLAFQ